MNAVCQLKLEQIDKMLGPEHLDTKKAITLSKYIFKGFDMLDQKDKSNDFDCLIIFLETTEIANYNVLLKV